MREGEGHETVAPGLMLFMNLYQILQFIVKKKKQQIFEMHEESLPKQWANLLLVSAAKKIEFMV